MICFELIMDACDIILVCRYLVIYVRFILGYNITYRGLKIMVPGYDERERVYIVKFR